METLILRTPSATQGDTASFKKLGYTNVRYFADVTKIDQTKPAAIYMVDLINDGSATKVIIEGAKIYKVNNGVVDLGTEFLNEVTIASTAVTAVGVAFIPSKNQGFIKIEKGADKISKRYFPMIPTTSSPNAVQVGLDFDSYLDRPLNLALKAVTNYTANNTNLFGDINNLSDSTSVMINAILLSINLNDKMSNNNWNKKFKSTSTFTTLYLTQGFVPIKIDLGIFQNLAIVSTFELATNGTSVYGDATNFLSKVRKFIVGNSVNTDGITGDCSMLNTLITGISIVAPNLKGNYTSRTYTGAIPTFKILSNLITEADYDLMLSDLATKATLLSNTATIHVSRRSSASDGSVATLTAKGCTVTVG